MNRARPVEATIEDLEFISRTGAGAEEAATRVGFPDSEALEKWLTRRSRYDLWRTLKHRDAPGTHHHAARRKERHLMPVDNTQDTQDPIAAILEKAGQSTRPGTRKKAQRATTLIDQLRTILDTEHDQDQTREQARKKIERLEAELAQAKAALRNRPNTTTPNGTSHGTTAAEIRAWAAANGIECNPTGRVPRTVTDAYEQAQ